MQLIKFAVQVAGIYYIFILYYIACRGEEVHPIRNIMNCHLKEHEEEEEDLLGYSYYGHPEHDYSTGVGDPRQPTLLDGVDDGCKLNAMLWAKV